MLPHEVDAEYTGIMTMWSHLKSICPDDADILMKCRLFERTEPNKTKYVIKRPENGFQSKEQIDLLFDEAYDKSLIDKRKLSAEFLRSDDELAQLFTNNGAIRTDYYSIYRQIQMAETGQEMDIKMASLVSYIHPELQKSYPRLDFKELDPLSVFGIPMPETREEILSRIDLQSDDVLSFDHIEEQDFAEAVADISDNDPEQSM